MQHHHGSRLYTVPVLLSLSLFGSSRAEEIPHIDTSSTAVSSLLHDLDAGKYAIRRAAGILLRDHSYTKNEAKEFLNAMISGSPEVQSSTSYIYERRKTQFTEAGWELIQDKNKLNSL